MKKKNIIVFIENIVFTILFLFFAEIASPDDPLFIHSKLHFTTFYFALITLFNGFKSSLIPFILIVVIGYKNYDIFPYFSVLENMLFLLLFGEFYTYWTKKIETQSELVNYLEKRNRELGRAFFSLKISHDQLEKSYVTKPVNIRTLFEEIKEMNLKNENKSYNSFLSLIAKYFAVEEMGLFIYHDKSFIPKAFIGDLFKFDKDDVLIKNSINKKVSSFVDLEESENSNYLAVIVALSSENNFLGLLVIKAMSFMDYNKENIQIISILTSYFMDEIVSQRECIQKERVKYLDYKLLKEIEHLSKLADNYSIISSLVAIKINKVGKHFIPLKLIATTLRQLDIMNDFENGDYHIVVILMPLTSESGVIGFSKRVEKFLSEFDYNLQYFDVKNESKLKQSLYNFIGIDDE